MSDTGTFHEKDLQSLFRVDGLIAVVTGGGSGLGSFMARALALNGASKVYILGRRLASLEECASSTTSTNIVPVECDVASRDSLSAAVNKISAETGGMINLLVCNAGMEGPSADASTLPLKGGKLRDFVEVQSALALDHHVETFKVNVVSIWSTVMAFLELLDAGNKAKNVAWSSQIVTTTSIAAFNRILPGTFTYAQSKAATTHLTKQLASILVPYRIRANAIAPGIYPTEMTGHWIDNKVVRPDLYPVQRFGDATDMAGAILFLASRAGAFISGNVLISDGGYLSTIAATY